MRARASSFLNEPSASRKYLSWRATAALAKSIAKLKLEPFAGLRPACRWPSPTVTSLRIRMTRWRASCRATPAHSIRNTNGAELPSMIGTSGPFSSITALSMPEPRRAAIRCSTVPTEAPCSLATTVQSLVSTTASHLAGMTARSLGRSVLTKLIPLSAAAGRSVMDTFAPPCRPMPVQWIADFRVCWNDVSVLRLLLDTDEPAER